MEAGEYVGRVLREGFAIVEGVLGGEALAALARDIAGAREGDGVRRRRRGVYAIRNLLEVVPRVRELAASQAVGALVRPVLGPGSFAVRGILFDKTPDAPWKVAWHQDLSIAVRERREAEGFGPWSLKAGAAHVQPPPEILGRMLTVRLHLDDADESNGALRVLPGSHLGGRLDARAVERWRLNSPAVTCAVPRGGALVMRPLLLHSSPTPRAARQRRVVHLEFAAERLPGGLEWRG